MRTFGVIVQGGRLKDPMKYPQLEGERALLLMRKLHARGFAVMAEISSHGLDEELDLPAMEMIYGDWVAQAPPPRGRLVAETSGQLPLMI